MKQFDGHATILVADVDCTTEGKPLCDSNGVKGFPTIKTGDPSNLEDYKGGRDFKSLESHAASLKPSCSPANIDLCDDEIAAAITDGDKKSADAETDFSEAVEKLQKAYQQLQDDKEATLQAIKDSGLGLIKAVAAARKAAPAEKAEL